MCGTEFGGHATSRSAKTSASFENKPDSSVRYVSIAHRKSVKTGHGIANATTYLSSRAETPGSVITYISTGHRIASA
eukprot:662614-Rhodomonas_salina.3